MEIICVAEAAGSLPTGFFFFFPTWFSTRYFRRAQEGRGVEVRLCKVICRARPRSGSGGPGRPRERRPGVPGDAEVVGRHRDSLSLWIPEKTAALAELCLGVPFRTQHFLPDPGRPDSGASGAWNVGHVSESLDSTFDLRFSLLFVLVSFKISHFRFLRCPYLKLRN